MALPKNIVSDFEQVTRYPLNNYMNSFVVLIEDHRDNIINYYSGSVKKPNERSFKFLKQILDESNVVVSIIDLHRERLSNAAYWELIEVLSDMQISLWTIDNSSKWLRSSISKNNFNPEVELSQTLKQFETLERLSGNVGSNDRDNDWINIALRNDLIEEEYTPDGGNFLITSRKNQLTVRLNSVIDNISGEKAYGIDLYRKITFENEDLKALSYKETVVQSVEILANLKQEQTPEFPEDGIQSSLLVGSNRAAIAYPVLFRQFYSTFKRDDTLKSLKVTKIKNEEDVLWMDFTVETRLGEEIEQIATL